MPENRWQSTREAWLPVFAGGLWLWLGAASGFIGFALSLAPGVLLMASGGAALVWPADRRSTQVAALGGVVGTFLGLLALFVIGLVPGLLLMLVSGAAFLGAGVLSLRLESHPEDLPEPISSLALSAKVALDEALLASMQVTLSLPSADEAARIPSEVDAAREYFSDRGWVEKPAEYHRTPLPLETPQISSARVSGRGGQIDYEVLSFESEYEPDREEPGRERWLGYVRNRKALARVVRHRDESRPWVVCIHGYQMGSPFWDLRAFDPRYYRDELGLNMLLPVLPLHGERKVGRRSGDGFLSGSPLDTIHAEAQAMWDIRRLLSWVRAQGAPAVGVHGISLGGYTTALLACLDEELSCVIAGVPAVDLPHLLWRHGPAVQVRSMERRGVVHDEVTEIFRVISPLALEPKLPKERRAIYGGICDRLVPPEQVRDLWEHWERPPMHWYQGSHLSFPLEPGVRALVDGTLREALRLS